MHPDDQVDDRDPMEAAAAAAREFAAAMEAANRNIRATQRLPGPVGPRTTNVPAPGTVTFATPIRNEGDDVMLPGVTYMLIKRTTVEGWRDCVAGAATVLVEVRPLVHELNELLKANDDG